MQLVNSAQPRKVPATFRQCNRILAILRQLSLRNTKVHVPEQCIPRGFKSWVWRPGIDVVVSEVDKGTSLVADVEIFERT